MIKKIEHVGKEEWISALKRKGGRSKYNAKKVTVNGRKFDSKREAEIACEMEMALKAGKIAEIEYQPRFELIPKPNKITYVADFLVTYPDGRKEVVDVKGFETPVFKLKKKMFNHFYPDMELVLLR